MWRNLGKGTRRSIIVLGVLLVLLLVIRVVLDPIAAHYLRQALNSTEEAQGTFAGVHIGIFPPGVDVRRLKIRELPNGRWEDPFFYVEKAHVGIVWRKLFHGQLVASALLDHPKLLLVPGHAKKTAKEKAKPLAETLRDQMPLTIDRFEIVGGEALLARGTGDQAAELWVNHTDVLAENLATRKKLMEGEPATLDVVGRVQRTGKLKMSFRMSPFAKLLTFSGKASLVDLDLRELYSLIADKSDLKPVEGTANVFVEVKCRDGVLDGGVKPVLKNVEVASSSKNVFDRLKALAADAAVHIASHNDHRIATVIPLEGKLADVHVQVVPAIMGVVRNAFVEGLTGGYAQLPPPVAEKKEGLVKQAIHALKKDQGQPKAQPEPGTHAGRKKR